MKKQFNIAFVALILMLFSTSMEAQKRKSSRKKTQKTSKSGFDYHKIEAGANLNFFVYPGSKTNVGFGPSITGGYRVTPGIVLGVRVGTQYGRYVSNVEGGIFGKFFIHDFFVGTGINAGSGSYGISEVFLDDYGYSYIYGNVEAGYRFDVTDHIKIEPALNVNLPIDVKGQKIWYGVRIGVVYCF